MGTVAPFYLYQSQSFKVNECTLPLTMLAGGESLGILVCPYLEDSAALFGLFNSPAPEFIPHPGARVPKKNPRLRFQQPA